MLLPILIIVAVLIAAFLILAAFQPSETRVTRSTLISAPPAAAFLQVNDLDRWQAVSPYAKMDPKAKTTFTGPRAGKDAALAWDGRRIGAGRMTVIESQPGRLVRYQLDFLRPFKSTGFAEFTFEPAGTQTAVTWTMHGAKNFLSKAMGLVVNMDRMIGQQFESGLVSIKAAAESLNPS